jgi:hypothetical protein
MRAMPGRRHTTARLARVLGFDGNPLRRASDRAEAWIRVGILAVFLMAGPLAALGAAHWAYHAAITAVQVPATQPHHVKAAILKPPLATTDPTRVNQGSQAWARQQTASAAARTGAVLAAVITLAPAR